MSVPPTEYLCPITHEVMEHPVTTVAGSSYEYSAIQTWMQRHSTDPLTNQRLSSTVVVPNNTLRSQILAWFDEHPAASHLRNHSAQKPPAVEVRTPSLDQVLLYKGTRTVGKEPMKKLADYEAFGHVYKFRLRTEPQQKKTKPLLEVQCDAGDWILAPDKEMYALPQGVVFYDPSEVMETRVLPDTRGATVCKFGPKCSRPKCTAKHPFVCLKGTSCRESTSGCKFQHPSLDSIVPFGKKYLSTECKYGTACTSQGCRFAHPNGRVRLSRVPAKVMVTHSHTLQPLNEPVEVVLQRPEAATKFQFQGAFVFYFVPFTGTWASEHYQTVIVHRWDEATQQHRLLGEYSLDKHYCNCATAAGRYMILSFWPYEEEAIRTIWDCLRLTRTQEKKLREVEKENGMLRAENARLKREVQANASKIYAMKQSDRAQRKKQEAAFRRQRQRQEWQRNERLRYRDPIHIYALAEGASGAVQEDWHLVVDYHKGAHDILLGPVAADGSQPLEIRENEEHFQFDLIAPDDLSALGPLPLVPAKLCPDF